MHGNGKYTSEGNFVFEGEFVKDVMHGHGVCTYDDGRIYTGQFDDDEMHGEGVCTYADGKREYKGQFKNDNMHGQGQFIFSDSTKYDGAWADDNMNGKGVLHSADGENSWEGEWAAGFKTIPVCINGARVPCSHATWSTAKACHSFEGRSLVRSVPAAAEATIGNAAEIKGNVALIERGRGTIASQPCSFPDKVHSFIHLRGQYISNKQTHSFCTGATGSGGGGSRCSRCEHGPVPAQCTVQYGWRRSTRGRV